MQIINPSTEGGCVTLQLPTPQTYGGSFLVFSSACRCRSMNVQIDDGAPSDVYVLIFDANAEPAAGTIPLLRTSLLTAGQQNWLREVATRDADMGGYPFDKGIWIAASTTPEYDPQNVVEALNVTARLQTRQCDPRLPNPTLNPANLPPR